MSYQSSRSSTQFGCFVVGAAVLVLAVLILFFASTARVGGSEVGIINNAGAIDTKQTALQPGWHAIVPFVQGVQTVSIAQQSHQFSEVQTAAHNQQAVYIDGTVSYHVDSTKAANLVIQGGADQVINRILWPAFQDYIKEVTPQYADYSDILNNRLKVRDLVKTQLQGKTDQFGLFVDDIFLTNIHPEKSYQDSINNAAKAQQDLTTAQNEAKAKVAAAQGDADSNKIRQITITDQVLQQQALNNQADMIKRWDGKLPQYMTGSNPLVIFGSPIQAKQP